MSRREEASDGAFESGAHIARARGPLAADKPWFELSAPLLPAEGVGVLAYATSEDERCAARFTRDEASAGRFEPWQGEARAEGRRTYGGTGSVSVRGGDTATNPLETATGSGPSRSAVTAHR